MIVTSDATMTFIMPAHAVELKAVFAQNEVETSYRNSSGLVVKTYAIPLDSAMKTLRQGTYVVTGTVNFTDGVTVENGVLHVIE